jgi:hypothetical protein
VPAAFDSPGRTRTAPSPRRRGGGSGAHGGVFCLGLVNVARHEMWSDELQSWMTVLHGASLSELFQHLRYGGHPGLRPIILVCLCVTGALANGIDWLYPFSAGKSGSSC